MVLLSLGLRCECVKILKHGNLKSRKFTCNICGCEFVADMYEYDTVSQFNQVVYYIAQCPDCRCDTTDNEPWEEENDRPGLVLSE